MARREDLESVLWRARDLVISLEESSRALNKAEELARQLLAVVPSAPLFVGIVGLDLQLPDFELVPGTVKIRPVTNPPGVIHVCQAADITRTDYLGIARYSLAIRAELAAGNLAHSEADNDWNRLLDLAWHAAALLRLRGHANFVCPAFTSTSWDTVAAFKEQKLAFQVLDDVPRYLSVSGPHGVTAEELAWVRDYFPALLEMRDAATSRRFSLAFDLMYRWNHTTDVRVAIQTVWCGLEALFGDRRDKKVTKGLVDRIAAWLPGTDPEHVRDLYDRRCDACHGRHLDPTEFREPAEKSAALLNAALIKAVETTTRTLPDWKL